MLRRRKEGERQTERSWKRGQLYHRCAPRDNSDKSDPSSTSIETLVYILAEVLSGQQGP